MHPFGISVEGVNVKADFHVIQIPMFAFLPFFKVEKCRTVTYLRDYEQNQTKNKHENSI